VRIRDRLGVSERRQRQITRGMELALVGFVFVGLERGNVGIVVNAAAGFAVTRLPGVLERDFEVPMDAGLSLWITSAVFLHALGAVGVPGSDRSFYRSVWWWDHLTHALSSSVVAAVGYTTVRAVDAHDDGVYLPRQFIFVFILLFVIAFGVFWEVLEFGLGGLAERTGIQILTQYGLQDTMWDLVFDVAGGILVALFGSAYLGGVVDHLGHRLYAARSE
jgi:hypothetical protein